jgi:hypothetical protein
MYVINFPFVVFNEIFCFILSYNIPDFFTAHETGGPKCTLPQRRRDAKFRRVALRNFAPLRLRGEKEF